MIIEASVKIGLVDYKFTFDEKDPDDTMHLAAVLPNPYRKCNCCGNDTPEKFKFDSNKNSAADTFIYIHCICGAKSNLGHYKAGGYYWKQFEKYVKPEDK